MPPEKALDPRKDLLRNPNYRWLLSGAMITNLGDQFTLIALPWLVLQMTHDTRVLGLVLALIGAGTEMMIPTDQNALGTENSAEDAARRSFAETFGQISEQTVSRNLDVQPTLEIRPGYRFNVLVDQDIVFPQAFR